mmetsp:Transcript_7464/g.21453  ORF Transcript_7464/g.21453 Transcript_7464/m.21453 type:complete len:355 (-) Transcript_7464:135-1199(-)
MARPPPSRGPSTAAMPITSVIESFGTGVGRSRMCACLREMGVVDGEVLRCCCFWVGDGDDDAHEWTIWLLEWGSIWEGRNGGAGREVRTARFAHVKCCSMSKARLVARRNTPPRQQRSKEAAANFLSFLCLLSASLCPLLLARSRRPYHSFSSHPIANLLPSITPTRSGHVALLLPIDPVVLKGWKNELTASSISLSYCATERQCRVDSPRMCRPYERRDASRRTTPISWRSLLSCLMCSILATLILCVTCCRWASSLDEYHRSMSCRGTGVPVDDTRWLFLLSAHSAMSSSSDLAPSLSICLSSYRRPANTRSYLCCSRCSRAWHFHLTKTSHRSSARTRTTAIHTRLAAVRR